MATCRDIQDWVKKRHGFVPKTCWIADCKEKAGLAPIRAPNRASDDRQVPCPGAKQEAIMSAFAHFGMVKAHG